MNSAIKANGFAYFPLRVHISSPQQTFCSTNKAISGYLPYYKTLGQTFCPSDWYQHSSSELWESLTPIYHFLRQTYEKVSLWCKPIIRTVQLIQGKATISPMPSLPLAEVHQCKTEVGACTSTYVSQSHPPW